MVVFRLATMAGVISLSFALLDAARAESLPQELEKLLQKRAELLLAQRFADALDVGRELLSAYEQHFGPDHRRSRFLRFAIRENERLARLSPEQLTELFRLKSQAEQEIKAGLSYRSVDSLGEGRVEIEGPASGDKPTR